jgi:serine/threonine protein kinase
MSDAEPRRYRIMSVVGKGGFGKVYRGRLEGPEGFYKDVAIKLLNERDVPETTLQRFRDEARILGLIRDRAIVTVDPPTRLDGRWAVVMEYVDGVSCAGVLRNMPFPPTVASEIIQECARALDKVYRQPGHDGQPLKLLHRDLKPGNIQITNSGEVKILDFGIARADFADREAETTHHIGGTIGYIAPERLGGIEGPSGDIYSLGVVLHVLITGDKPTRPGEYKPRKHRVERTEAVETILAYARKMASLDPNQRPVAREVEDSLSELRARIPGPSLRRWAEKHVPEAAEIAKDGLVGTLVTETLANLPMMPNSIPDFTDTKEAGKSLFTIAVAGLAALLLVAGGWVYMRFTATVDTPIDEPVAAVAPTQIPAAPPPVAAPPTPEAAPAPEVEKPAPKVAPRPAKRPAPVAKPTPAPPPAPTGPTYNISFSSVPLGAAVYIDGEKVGTTPLINTPLVAGDHTVRMESASGTIERTIRAGRRSPARYIWRGSDQWESQH